MDNANIKNKIQKVEMPELKTRPFTAGFRAREFDKIMSKANFIFFQLQEKKCDNLNPSTLKYYKNKTELKGSITIGPYSQIKE